MIKDIIEHAVLSTSPLIPYSHVLLCITHVPYSQALTQILRYPLDTPQPVSQYGFSENCLRA